MRSVMTRRFEQFDQIEFAELSGDWNPIHVDPVCARRSVYGQIVHGVNAVAWALEGLISETGIVPGKVRVAFLKPISLYEEVCAVWRLEGTETVILIQRGTQTFVSIRIQPGGQLQASACANPPTTPCHIPVDRNFSSLRGEQGILEAWGYVSFLERDFPNLVRTLGPLRTAALFSLSRLVGMICPGLHSIFSGINIAFTGSEGVRIPYRVVRHSIHNAPLRISYRGAGIEGTLDAFVRPVPASQPDIDVIRHQVEPGEFAGQTALVVGGSRGLGETLAKIIAAGGGTPIVTYNVGEQDAVRVQNEICAAGGDCDILRMDVLNMESVLQDLTANGLRPPTHLYYFASPIIRANKSPALRSKLGELYHAYYVEAFGALCRALARGKGAQIFYPSTIYIKAAPDGLMEYVNAKAAGEVLCSSLAQEYPNLTFYVERLPRMHTDQTNSILERRGVDPLGPLLAVARKCQKH